MDSREAKFKFKRSKNYYYVSVIIGVCKSKSTLHYTSLYNFCLYS